MRIRSMLAAAVTTVAFVGLAATPASAGTGPSQWCSDPHGFITVPNITSPVTFGVEVTVPPGGNFHQLVICYSTSATTTPNSIIGGAFIFRLSTDTGLVTPGATTSAECFGDSGVSVGPITCPNIVNGAHIGAGDIRVDTPPNAVCLVALNFGCAAYAPGLRVDPDSTGTPLVAVQTASIPVNLDVPLNCVAVLVSC